MLKAKHEWFHTWVFGFLIFLLIRYQPEVDSSAALVPPPTATKKQC